MANIKLTALELVLTFLAMFGPVTKESLAAVCVLFEAVLSYDYEKGKFEKDAVKKVCGVADYLIAMAELYGVKCDAKQLVTPGGRRAILRVILGPVLKGLAIEDLERMRNDAVEAMMILTFKPLDEVQDMLTEWTNEAIEGGLYQARVCSWTGLPMELQDATSKTEKAIDAKPPIMDEVSIGAVISPCGLALEIVFTFLTMLGPVTEDSVAATGVLFGAVFGYSEATGKFDKETVNKVPIVGESLCSLAFLYGARCEARMLNTPPGARAILRVLVGPIIEGYSPSELDEMRKDAAAAIMLTTCKPLEEVEAMAIAWAVAATKDGRYQVYASAWTGKPADEFNVYHTIETEQTRPKAIYGSNPGCDPGDHDNLGERPTFEDEASEDPAEAAPFLEMATSTTVIKLVTVQALFAMDILPKQEVPFTTVFPTPLDVCFGRLYGCTSVAFDKSNAVVQEKSSSHVRYAHDLDGLDDVKALVDESDEEDYHRLVGFLFPALSPPTPVLGVSTGSTPEITPLGSPTFEQWIATWHEKEMSAWNAVLQEEAKKEVQAEERKAMFGPHADAWENKQLSEWSAALKDEEEDGYSSWIYANAASPAEVEVATLEAIELDDGEGGKTLLMSIGRFLGVV